MVNFWFGKYNASWHRCHPKLQSLSHIQWNQVDIIDTSSQTWFDLQTFAYHGVVEAVLQQIVNVKNGLSLLRQDIATCGSQTLLKSWKDSDSPSSVTINHKFTRAGPKQIIILLGEFTIIIPYRSSRMYTFIHQVIHLTDRHERALRHTYRNNKTRLAHTNR